MQINLPWLTTTLIQPNILNLIYQDALLDIYI